MNKKYNFTSNTLIPIDIELDSIVGYQIGQIPPQTVWHNSGRVGFYVLTDSLKSSSTSLSYSMNGEVAGKIDFNSQTGKFIYVPDYSDIREFAVTFMAASKNESITQEVIFTPMPDQSAEYTLVENGSTKPLPDGTDEYTIITQSEKKMFFNNQERTVYSISISGKKLIFDNTIKNKLNYLSDREDIYELNLFAEEIIVRQKLNLPQTTINIYAKNLIFEDNSNSEKAALDNTPVRIEEFVDDKGIDGSDAGTMNVYIHKFTSNLEIRFISIGSNGQSSNRNGTPGNGGNGGTISATLDLKQYCDMESGAAGVSYESANKEIIRAGQKGEKGEFIYINEQYAWLHPYIVSTIVRYANSAFVDSNSAQAYELYNEYTDLITDYQNSNEWSNLTSELSIDLENSQREMQAALYNISNNLDYFGNVPAWAPNLSFEVTKLVFDQEVESSIRVLYVSYWLKNINASLEQRIQANEEVVKILKKELEANREALNELVFLIPDLQNELEILLDNIEDLRIRTDELIARLEQQAKRNVKKRNRAIKNASIFKTLLGVVPTVIGFNAPVLGALAGNALSSIYSIFSPTPELNFLQDLSSFDYKQNLEDFELIMGNLNVSAASNEDLSEAYKRLNGTINTMTSGIAELNSIFSKSSAPKNEVEAELERLKSESPELKELVQELEVLNLKKEEYQEKIVQTFAAISNLYTEVPQNLIAIDGFNKDIFEDSSRRDLRAMQYLNNMEEKAKNRLLKYHYYMAKAYEYRLLLPYKSTLDLTTMFERFRNIAETNPEKMILDQEDYHTLKTIFDEQISNITETIIDTYNKNQSELSANPLLFTLEKEELDILNQPYGEVHINPYKRGMFQAGMENIRIVDFKIHSIKAHSEDEVSSFGYTDFSLKHSGVSQFRSNGDIFMFNHKNYSGESPIMWKSQYDVKFDKLGSTNAPSYASESLLYAILKNLNKEDQIMIYSRPGAYADFILTKNDVTATGTKIIIDEIVLELQYDYTQRSSNLVNLDVYTDNGLQPYIIASRKDRNDRGSGRGLLQRSYLKETNVSFEAPLHHGQWRFTSWTDRQGNVLSEEPTIQVRMNRDQTIIASYKSNLPVLSAVDSVFVDAEAGTEMIFIENSNGYTREDMEWYTSWEEGLWFSIDEKESVLNDGFITVSFESNEEKSKRIAPILITSEDTENPEFIVYLVQSGIEGDDEDNEEDEDGDGEEDDDQDGKNNGEGDENNDNEGDEDNDKDEDTPPTMVDNKKISIELNRISKNIYEVNFNREYKKIKMEIFDQSGKLVLQSYQYNLHTSQIDLSSYQDGVYLLRLILDENPSTHKLFK